MTDEALLTIQAELQGVLLRIALVRDLYLREGVTAAELYEAERLGARFDGIAYALTYIDRALEPA